MNEFTIYTKDNCKYCTKAKSLLKERGLTFTEYALPTQATKEDIVAMLKASGSKAEIKTVPQIFNGTQYIGGFTELETYLGS